MTVLPASLCQRASGQLKIFRLFLQKKIIITFATCKTEMCNIDR
jgi:hypothetical protein